MSLGKLPPLQLKATWKARNVKDAYGSFDPQTGAVVKERAERIGSATQGVIMSLGERQRPEEGYTIFTAPYFAQIKINNRLFRNVRQLTGLHQDCCVAISATYQPEGFSEGRNVILIANSRPYNASDTYFREIITAAQAQAAPDSALLMAVNSDYHEDQARELLTEKPGELPIRSSDPTIAPRAFFYQIPQRAPATQSQGLKMVGYALLALLVGFVVKAFLSRSNP